ELARHVVDGRDVVRVNGVPQPETIGEHRRSQKQRIIMERCPSPGPDNRVGSDKARVKKRDRALYLRGHPAFRTWRWVCLCAGSPAWACLSVSTSTGTMTSRPCCTPRSAIT